MVPRMKAREHWQVRGSGWSRCIHISQWVGRPHVVSTRSLTDHALVWEQEAHLSRLAGNPSPGDLNTRCLRVCNMQYEQPSWLVLLRMCKAVPHTQTLAPRAS
jgi:hypothetical protein